MTRPTQRPGPGLTAPSRTGPTRWRRSVPPTRLARSITVYTLVAFALITAFSVVGRDWSAPLVGFALLCVAVVFTLQFFHSSTRSAGWSAPVKAVSFTVQAVFTYLPLTMIGFAGIGMIGCLQASALLGFRGRVAAVLSGSIAVSVIVFARALDFPAIETVYVTVGSTWMGVVLFALGWLTDLIGEVHANRRELARLAVTHERLRFARDLHDLLGYSLSAITLKAELTQRLIPVRPERADEEITSILQISRQALADVRTVASGYRQMSLLEEVSSAASILAAATIDVDVVDPDGPFHPVVDQVLAAALREGVTNILRHSAVRRCTISVTRPDPGTVRLAMVNDGLATEPRSRGRQGGLDALTARVAALGGRVDARVRDDGRFHLIVEVPAEPCADPEGEAEDQLDDESRASVAV